jgi:hypothetical protein
MHGAHEVACAYMLFLFERLTTDRPCQGKAAMQDGKWSEAYVLYFACTFYNTVNPVFFANKAAAALAKKS